MQVLLTITEQHEGQKIEIDVIYNPNDNTVEEILSVQIDTPVGMVSVSDLFMNIPEMDVAINKIVDRTDLREIYRQQQPDMQDAA